MKNIVTKIQAANLLIGVFSLLLIFHLSIIKGYIPYDIVWGGMLRSEAEMIQFETISIVLNFTMMGIIILYRRQLLNNHNIPYFNVLIWMMVVLFAMNTIGNLFAKSNLELFVFTPLTFVISLLCFRLNMKS